MDAETALTPSGFAETQKEQLESEIKVSPARAFYPSSLGHPCDRAIVWGFTKWEQKARHDWTLESIFQEGRLHQPTVYARLERMGFDIIRESDRPVQYKVRGAVISGRPDGKIRGYRGTHYTPPRVLEIKSASAYTFDALNTMEDILRAPQHYTRAYADQAYLYAFLENLLRGVIVLKNKTTGLLKLIPFELDYARAETLLQRVERLQPMIEQGVDPDPIPYDRNICGRCEFNHICYPPKSYGEGTAVLDDAALIEDLEQREKLRAAKAEYEEIDKSVKTRLKAAGVKSAIAGPFVIEATERQVKGYEVKARTDLVFEIRRLETTP